MFKCYFKTPVYAGKARDEVDLTQKNLQNLSPDYDSIPETEVNESPSISTTPETVFRTEDVSNNYSALTERPITFQLPVVRVYSSLEVNGPTVHLEAFQYMVPKDPPDYVNMAIE